MLEEVGNPFGVFSVCLPPRNGLHMVRIDDQDFTISLRASLNTGFQYTPVAIFGDMTASLLFKPITKV